MSPMMIVLRLLHIGLGVVWAGSMVFVALWMEPSIRGAGPDGAKVMLGLKQRGYFVVLPVVALLTILTGLELLRRISGGFNAGWLTSRTGFAFSVGAAAALVAFAIGVGVLRPAATRMFALGPTVASLPAGAERQAGEAELGRLRRRVTVRVRWVAGLLAITVAAMAVARYL